MTNIWLVSRTRPDHNEWLRELCLNRSAVVRARNVTDLKQFTHPWLRLLLKDDDCLGSVLDSACFTLIRLFLEAHKVNIIELCSTWLPSVQILNFTKRRSNMLLDTLKSSHHHCKHKVDVNNLSLSLRLNSVNLSG